MKRYIVEYQQGLDEPGFFACEADDTSHAVEQADNAYPDAQIIAAFVECDIPGPMKPTYYHCGICDQYHAATWDGDCREDGARFNPEDLDAQHGRDGWEEIDMGDVDAWRRNGRVLPDTETRKCVSDLREGDRVDLAGDPYADPNGSNPLFECNYAVVESVERETPKCVAVTFEHDTVGFPADHVVTVAVGGVLPEGEGVLPAGEDDGMRYAYVGDTGIEFAMTLDQAESGYHQGACDFDVATLVKEPDIAAQLAKIDDERMRGALRGWGAWDDEELADREANERRFVWLAAADIVEEEKAADRDGR